MNERQIYLKTIFFLIYDVFLCVYENCIYAARHCYKYKKWPLLVQAARSRFSTCTTNRNFLCTFSNGAQQRQLWCAHR
jgi:hypothetical protein